jgi:hypothetical protein
MGFQRFLVTIYSIKRVPGIGVITITQSRLRTQPTKPVIATSVNVTEWSAITPTAARMAPSN